MKGLGFAAVVLGLAIAGGCAKGASGFEEEGEGGAGGAAGGGMGGMMSGAGGTMSSSASSTSASSTSASSSSASSTSASSTGAGGPMCGPTEHLCNGACTGNTPATGCFTSVSCSACAAIPNGVPICTAQGTCDVSCDSGYVKSGGTCVCSFQAPNCCTNAECAAGETCMSGTCTGGGGGGSCDQALCAALCLIQMKLGLCVNNTCTCL